ncbi:RING-variant domain-containing protein [Carex littledalei]|uniref:RING-variant domain-containing protein n=1 Tax=Carex littledalei TaxID=544730 RepID=A0A833QEF7_9POAL|nr:RING-variant domain-containing protein [Carex littledalei]
MELNNTPPGSPSIRCVSEARISIQSLPFSPPPSPLSNPTAGSRKMDHDLVPCVVIDLGLKVEEDTVVVVECQSTKLSSVSNFSTEKICRICHVSSGCAGNGSELIDLGCGCKNGLGIAHQHCAETWFKIKGNRIDIDIYW